MALGRPPRLALAVGTFPSLAPSSRPPACHCLSHAGSAWYVRCTCSCRCKSPLHRRLGGTGTVPFRSANFTRRSDIELLSCVCWPGQVVSRVHFCAPQICCIQGTPLLPAPCRTPQFFAIPVTGVARFDAYARRPRAQEPPLAAGLGSSPPPPPPPPTPRGRLGKGGAWGSAATSTPTLGRHCCGWGW